LDTQQLIRTHKEADGRVFLEEYYLNCFTK